MGGGVSSEARIATQQYVTKIINENTVCLFSKTYDPVSIRAKKVLFGCIPHQLIKIYELDRLEEGPLIADELKNLTGDGKAPRVFVNGEFYGDADRIIQEGWDGRLKQYLIQKGVIQP
eukprot:TRINITY_DN691_c0_g1_i1.p3 TRINITY_DN691_c0_g1~~TRINITY_DN691_c0_g1_i1.p3  ORF type:complete len:118 (-),score=14.25 TRINITY_DN691_c0_g1_i1:178-531(-)